MSLRGRVEEESMEQEFHFIKSLLSGKCYLYTRAHRAVKNGSNLSMEAVWTSCGIMWALVLLPHS